MEDGGYPKTIDNDVAFMIAPGVRLVRTVAKAIEYLRTRVSHDRVMVLETMGRHAGHLALHGGCRRRRRHPHP